MKCAMCGGKTVKKTVEEEVRLNGNHIMVEVEAEVCENCHEKYFSSEAMDKLINIKEKAGKEKRHLQEIGLVYKYS